MKNYVYITFLLFIIGCAKHTSNNKDIMIELGVSKESARSTWVYLCGLTQDFYSIQETATRNQLDALGKKLSITFLALCPPARCQLYNNALCWPHETPEKIDQTYNYITQHLSNYTISGYIGFSNGGFFLNQLVQTIALPVPCISIGASGYLHKAIPNNLYLLIGKSDYYHYADALQFYTMAQHSPLNVQLIEYEGGHEMPMDSIEKFFRAQR